VAEAGVEGDVERRASMDFRMVTISCRSFSFSLISGSSDTEDGRGTVVDVVAVELVGACPPAVGRSPPSFVPRSSVGRRLIASRLDLGRSMLLASPLHELTPMSVLSSSPN